MILACPCAVIEVLQIPVWGDSIAAISSAWIPFLLPPAPWNTHTHTQTFFSLGLPYLLSSSIWITLQSRTIDLDYILYIQLIARIPRFSFHPSSLRTPHLLLLPRRRPDKHSGAQCAQARQPLRSIASPVSLWHTVAPPRFLFSAVCAEFLLICHYLRTLISGGHSVASSTAAFDDNKP